MQNRDTLCSHKAPKADSQEETPHPGSEMKTLDSLTTWLMALAEALPLGSRLCLCHGGAPSPRSGISE